MIRLLLFMDTLDTLDTLLFGKNKNKNNFFVVIGIYYYNQDIFTSKTIKNIFLKIDFKGVHPVHPVQKQGELTNDYYY